MTKKAYHHWQTRTSVAKTLPWNGGVMGAISVMFLCKSHCCFTSVREMKYASQHCCDKTMDGKMALIA